MFHVFAESRKMDFSWNIQGNDAEAKRGPPPDRFGRERLDRRGCGRYKTAAVKRDVRKTPCVEPFFSFHSVEPGFLRNVRVGWVACQGLPFFYPYSVGVPESSPAFFRNVCRYARGEAEAGTQGMNRDLFEGASAVNFPERKLCGLSMMPYSLWPPRSDLRCGGLNSRARAGL